MKHQCIFLLLLLNVSNNIFHASSSTPTKKHGTEKEDNGKCTMCQPPSSEWYNTKSNIKQSSFSPEENNISHVYDRRTNKVITPNALQIKFPSELTNAMMEYCNKRGITKLFRELVTDKPLDVGTDDIRTLSTGEENGTNTHRAIDWLIQRPEKHWNSNMHWISPPDETTQDDYLNMLFQNGFNDVLADLGEYLNMDGLVAYQLTFIGVSYCEKGYMHHDFSSVQNKAFNIIIPLVCSSMSHTDASDAELLLQDDTDYSKDYGYKYVKDVGIAVGDNAIHATAPCDYRDNPGEMRMAATVYVADVNEDNVESIVSIFSLL